MTLRLGKQPRRKTGMKILSPTFKNPQSLSGLAAWYDATKIVGYANGANATLWSDLSGNNHHLIGTYSSGYYCPTYAISGINGLPAIHFSNTLQQFMSCTAALPQPLTFFVAGNCTGGTSSGRIIDDGGSGARLLADVNFGGHVAYYAGLGIAYPMAPVTSTQEVWTFQFNGASSICRINGIQGATVNPGPFGLQHIDLGGWPAFGFDGYVGEYIIYSGALTTSQMQTVEKYLKTKWGTP